MQVGSNANLIISSFAGDFSTFGRLEAVGSVHGAGIGGGSTFVGYGEQGAIYNVQNTANMPPAARTVPTLEPVTVPVAIKIPQILTSQVSEKTTSRDSTLSEIKQFKNSNGVSLLNRPQTIKITQGDGKTASVTVYELDTMEDVAKKINDAIAKDLDVSSEPDTLSAKILRTTNLNLTKANQLPNSVLSLMK